MILEIKYKKCEFRMYKRKGFGAMYLLVSERKTVVLRVSTPGKSIKSYL